MWGRKMVRSSFLGLVFVVGQPAVGLGLLEDDLLL